MNEIINYLQNQPYVLIALAVLALIAAALFLIPAVNNLFFKIVNLLRGHPIWWVILGVISTLLLVAAFYIDLDELSDFKLPTNNKVGSEKNVAPPNIKLDGSLSNSIVGPIKSINKSTREIVVFNTRDGIEYKVLVGEHSYIYEKNQAESFDSLKVDLHVGVYSEKPFDSASVNKDFNYILITGSPIPEKITAPTGDIPQLGGR